MKTAILHLCKGLAQVITEYYANWDRETIDLMRALAAWVEKHQ